MLQDTIRQELKYTPHLLVQTKKECRVYNSRKDYYVAVTDIDSSLPVLVSLQRLGQDSSDYTLYRKVEAVVDAYNWKHRKELTLCG